MIISDFCCGIESEWEFYGWRPDLEVGGRSGGQKDEGQQRWTTMEVGEKGVRGEGRRLKKKGLLFENLGFFIFY